MTLKSQTPLLVAALWFLFVTLNVNQTLGLIYIAGFSIIPMIIFIWDKVKTTPLDRNGKWLLAVIQGAGVYVAFALISVALLPFFEKIPLTDVLNLLSASAPAFAASKILNTITFVLFIPFVETITFVMLMDYAASKWRLNITRKGLFNIGTLLLIAGLSFLFLLLHVTAKGVTNNAALLLVFLMMFVSLVATIIFGESKQAIIFHIIANSFGIGLFSSLI